MEHEWDFSIVVCRIHIATLSQFSSRSRAFGKGKETAATQATRHIPISSHELLLRSAILCN